MARKRAQNASDAPTAAAALPAAGAEPRRYGPLSLERMHKEDGRTLISFARAAPPGGEHRPPDTPRPGGAA